jgi:ceramide glucosyltransferase
LQPVISPEIRVTGQTAATHPQVTVIVPVAGAQCNLEEHLVSLLRQDYPRYAVLFVTQDEQDPAVPLIQRIITKERITPRHIVAGKATTCSQKNHNLLQGVLALDSAADILIFCDSGHYAHPQWLERLILPLQASSPAVVSSGYHIVYPGKKCICSTGRAICVLTLSLIRRIPALAQPWGGSIAIRPGDFKDLGIAELWNSTIVDDVTLAAHLQKRKLKVAIPKDADVRTVIDNCSWSAWSTWLTRQLAYLKFLFPRLWFSAGVAAIAFTLLVSCCIFIVVTGGLLGLVPLNYLIASSAFIIAGIAGSSLLRVQHPAPGSFILWYPAVLAALFMAGWCHGRTWFSDSIVWAGITYKVAPGGKVLKIIRPEGSCIQAKDQ